MTVAFEELEGSPTIGITEQGTVAMRSFRVDWDDWPAFARELVGRYSTIGCSFIFVPPLEFPGMPNLVVSEIDVAPFDPGNPEGSEVLTLTSGTNRYPDAGAKVTARYRTLFDSDNRPRADLPGVPDGTYLTFSADMGTDGISTPGRIWKWDNVGEKQLAPDRNPKILVPTTTYRLAWHRVAMPAWSAISALRGHVNQSAFLGSTAETVMFSGARIAREFQFIEDGGFWKVEYIFIERTVPLGGGGVGGWNHHYNEADGDWVKIKDGNSNPPHRLADFSTLFQFGVC